MSWLEFIVKTLETIFRYLPWPIALLLIVLQLKNQISALLMRLLAVKFKGLDVQFADISRALIEGKIPESEKAQWKLKQVSQENPFYTLYSNGLLVEKLKVKVPPGTRDIFITFPISLPNQVTSVQVIGDIDWRLEQLTLSYCRLIFSPAMVAREIELRIAGL